MPDPLFMSGMVLVPLVFDLVPAFHPIDSPAAIRWGLWLAVIGLAG